MANRLIPREQVHAWSENIAKELMIHQPSIQRLLKSQRRLTRFIEENQESMKPRTVNLSVYMCGVIIRMFDLAGGTLRGATWEEVRAAQQKVAGWLDQLLPFDEGFVDRFHAIEGRAQAHLLDEAAMAMLQREPGEGEEEVERAEALKILLLCCVITEVLDANWRPPADFVGEESYTYHHIEPAKASA
jgi:hypothetical protein